MKLNPVNRTKNGNRYCGPAVISSVTGCTTDEGAKFIRTLSGQRAVRGSFTCHVIESLRQHWGVRSHEHFHIRSGQTKPTLATWLRENRELLKPGRVYLIVAGHHFQLVSGRKYVCGITREVVSIKHDKVKRRARVESVHELIGTPKITGAGLAALASKPVQSDKVIARKLAREYGITIELENYYDDDDLMGWVDASFLGDDDDPLYDNHYGFGWHEIREKVETLVDYLKEHNRAA